MNDSPQSGQVWSDERWQLYVASLPPILRPGDVNAVPQWMLYRPGAFPRRFDTHFFFTTMPSEQAAEHDRLETTEGVWIRPDEALSRFQEGTIPTRLRHHSPAGGTCQPWHYRFGRTAIRYWATTHCAATCNRVPRSTGHRDSRPARVIMYEGREHAKA